MILVALSNESNSSNARYVLNVVACIVFEEHRQTPELLIVVARAVVEKIGLFAWPEDVTCAALDMLTKLILLIKGSPEMHASLGREIILALCAFVDRLLDQDNLVVSSHFFSAFSTFANFGMTATDPAATSPGDNSCDRVHHSMGHARTMDLC